MQDQVRMHPGYSSHALSDALAEIERLRGKLRVFYGGAEYRAAPATALDHIVGNSAALRAVLDQVVRVAKSDSTILLTGETGTGKELIAHALHRLSSRAEREMVKVSCAALAPELAESEFFGHEKGAFTGALHKRVGRFTLAHRGTIFLDEVGELSTSMQATLLQVLEDGGFAAVGSNVGKRVDVRIVAATNVDLDHAISSGAFRADLYYRLNVVPIHLPPLRERLEDIPALASFLLERISRRVGRRYTGLSQASLQRLAHYRWPGNVRELRNVIERAAVLSPSAEVVIDSGMLGSPDKCVNRSEALEDVEREHIASVLQRTSWRIDGERGAACILRLHPSTLRSRMKKLGIVRGGS